MLVILVSCYMLCIFPLALAQVTPTTPGPNATYDADSNCNIAWITDNSGSWTNMSIDFMSGSNDDMTLVSKVVSGLDGTDSTITPYSWTCPEVKPYSAIYFYQFTNDGDDSTAAWTTRFTIASPSGDTTAPANAQQVNGDQIPWGDGHLASASNSTQTLAFSASSATMSPDDAQDSVTGADATTLSSPDAPKTLFFSASNSMISPQDARDPAGGSMPTVLALPASNTQASPAPTAANAGSSKFTTALTSTVMSSMPTGACSNVMMDSSAGKAASSPARIFGLIVLLVVSTVP